MNIRFGKRNAILSLIIGIWLLSGSGIATGSDLDWNTFPGSSGNDDFGAEIALDASGNIIITGRSKAGWGLSPLRNHSGGDDGFVAKLDAGGNLMWHTFLGSPGTDYCYGIAFDDSGNIYVTGAGDQTWGASPITPYAGAEDAFVAKLDGDGNLLWHTFLGSVNRDTAYGIAAGDSGAVYVTGAGDGSWGTSPRNPYAGNGDAFIACLNTNGELLWNTFLGSAGSDYGYGIAVDQTGEVYVSGGVVTYPVDVNAFAAKFESNGNLLWQTTLGSTGEDFGYGIAVDSMENVYITGVSDATWGLSPVTAFAGENDAFVARLNPNGTLMWNTFLGSADYEGGIGIAVDAIGGVYVSGYSQWTWGSPHRAYSGSFDGFAAKLTADGNLIFNTFLGSTGYDDGIGIAVDQTHTIFVIGHSLSSWGAPVNAYSGGREAYVAKTIIPAVTGDMNGSGIIDAGDLAAGVKVLTHTEPSGLIPDYAASGVDVNGDHIAGFPEIIYDLQVLSRARRP